MVLYEFELGTPRHNHCDNLGCWFGVLFGLVANTMINYARLGYYFEKQTSVGLEQNYEYHLKIPDARTMKGFHLKHAPKVPCDFLACRKGNTYFFECKQTSLKSLPLRNIADHQIQALTDIHLAGVETYFLIKFGKRPGRCYKVPILQFNKYVKRAKSWERKSIPEGWLEVWEVDKIKGGWDV